MVYACVARPAMGFIHREGPCMCFSDGPRPEFPSSSGVPPQEENNECYKLWQHSVGHTYWCPIHHTTHGTEN